MGQRLTKRPMILVAVRLPIADRERWFAASKLLGITQAEFLRTALRERAEKILVSAASGVMER